MNPVRAFLARHWQINILILVIIASAFLLYLLRSVLLPFVIGLILSYLLQPIINWLEVLLPPHRKWQQPKRVLLVLLCFLVMAALLGLFSYYIAAAVIHALVVILENAPQYMAAALQAVHGLFAGLRSQFPPEIQVQIDNILIDIGTEVGSLIRNSLLNSVTSIPQTFSLIIGFGSLPLFLFYLLKEPKKMSQGFYAVFPSWLAIHIRNVVSILENVVGRYVRAQLMLGVVVGYFSFIGLLILKLPFAPVLAAVAGVGELVPTIGPWIGGSVAVVITLAVFPDKAVWVAFVFFIVQILENTLLVPRIQGGYLRLHPAVLIILLVLGTYVAGIWGILLAGPTAATVIELVKYIRNNIEQRAATGVAIPQEEQKASTQVPARQ